MSLILPRGKKWQKLEGQIKIEIQNIFFNDSSNNWIAASTMVPYPLEENEKLEDIFLSFVEFDLNSKRIEKIKVVACRYVHAIID